ncbi:uncharacterized protein [Musca autumnalis]|uniref:uncharacterized protein n=1 Tax=Musca autumnalis TaxID=221902 RepID=UPI003CEA4EB1
MSNNTRNNLLPPTSLMIPQTILTNSGGGGGSATGNPRNKCALKPGHSLMDWIRLGNSGVDLSGTKGRIVPVTPEELAKHNTRNDAWMAIRGVVYNVTRYMDFHPGGVDELKRGVGKDATKLFNEVLAWGVIIQIVTTIKTCKRGHEKKNSRTTKSYEDFYCPKCQELKMEGRRRQPKEEEPKKSEKVIKSEEVILIVDSSDDADDEKPCFSGAAALQQQQQHLREVSRQPQVLQQQQQHNNNNKTNNNNWSINCCRLTSCSGSNCCFCKPSGSN